MEKVLFHNNIVEGFKIAAQITSFDKALRHYQQYQSNLIRNIVIIFNEQCAVEDNNNNNKRQDYIYIWRIHIVVVFYIILREK